MATVFSDLKSLKVTSSFFPLFLSRKATGRRTPTLPSPASTGCRTNPRVFASGGRSSGIGWSCWVRSSLGWEHWEHWPGSTKIHSCFHSFRSRLIDFLHVVSALPPQTATLARRSQSGRRRPRWSWRSGTPGRTSSWRRPRPTTGSAACWS